MNAKSGSFMNVDELLSRLEAVRPTSRGWIARCPAHADRSPSLSVSEGERGILVKCWAGCSAEEICASLALTLQDLFFDSAKDPRARRRPGPKPRRLDWRKTAAAFMGHADALYLRASNVLEAAKGLDCSTWTDADIETAMNAVASAYQDLERAELLKDVACMIRLRGLTLEEEQQRRKRDARAA
jgi:hypothetical protein